MKLTNRHWILLAIMITEVLGFSLILPFLPLYAQDLGATPLVVGLLITSFSFFQFITAPIMGELSDKHGRRPLLMISQLATTVSFVILALSNQLWMIFLSRIVDGLLGSNATIARAYLGDITSKKNRSKAFGITGIAFGVGFMIGPAIGGWLSQFGYSTPAWIAAAISSITILLTYLFLPETVNRNQAKEQLSFQIINIDKIKAYFSQPVTRQKLSQFSLYILSHSIWASNFSLFANKALNVGAQQVGFALAYVGAISIVIRGILIPRLIDLLGEPKLERIGLISILIGLTGSTLTRSWTVLLAINTFYAFGGGVLRPIMMGDISRSVSEGEQGAIMGVTSSINSLGQIFGPIMGGLLLTHFFPQSIMILAIIFMSATSHLVFRKKPAESISVKKH